MQNEQPEEDMLLVATLQLELIRHQLAEVLDRLNKMEDKLMQPGDIANGKVN